MPWNAHGARVPAARARVRDALPPLVCHARGGEVRRDRLHRALLQPQAPPLDNRLQGAGRRDGRVLRALRERVVEAEGGVASGINPGFFVSEILTQITPTYDYILDNIANAADLIDIVIRADIDKDNVSEMKELLFNLKNRGLNKKVGIYFVLTDDVDGDTCIDSCHCISARDFPTQR